MADPKKDGYQAFDIKRGSAMQGMGPATWAAGIRAFRQGPRIETYGQDVYQLSSMFILGRDGIVRYARYAKHSGDHPKTTELVEALRKMKP